MNIDEQKLYNKGYKIGYNSGLTSNSIKEVNLINHTAPLFYKGYCAGYVDGYNSKEGT